jgi:hypothetical protein
MRNSTKNFGFWVNHDLEQKISELALKEGKKPSEWIRSQIMQIVYGADPIAGSDGMDDRTLVRTLKGIGYGLTRYDLQSYRENKKIAPAIRMELDSNWRFEDGLWYQSKDLA